MVGLPVNTICFASGSLSIASLNPTATTSTLEASSFVVFPGNALLSCINVGIFKRKAAIIAGAVTYPPVPTTKSIFSSFIIFFTSDIPFISSIPARTFAFIPLVRPLA